MYTGLEVPPAKPEPLIRILKDRAEENEKERLLRREEFWKEAIIASLRSGNSLSQARVVADSAVGALEVKYHAEMRRQEQAAIDAAKGREITGEKD